MSGPSFSRMALAAALLGAYALPIFIPHSR